MKRKSTFSEEDRNIHKRAKIDNIEGLNKMGFFCQYCPRSFFTGQDRDSHVATHEYLCEKCDMKLFSMADLKNHTKENHEQSGPKQTNTDPTVKIVSKLNESVQEVELNGKLTFKCRYCAVTFVNKNETEDHIKSIHVNVLDEEKIGRISNETINRNDLIDKGWSQINQVMFLV